MKAFDTDIVTLIFHGDARLIQKAAQTPTAQRCIPIVVAEQVLRGRLHAIRLAEAGKGKAGIDAAYSFLEQTIADLKRTRILSFTPEVEQLGQSWRQQRIKVGI